MSNGVIIEEEKHRLRRKKDNPFLSNTFKLWVVAFIFFVTFFHLYAITKYPKAKIVSDELVLSVVLSLMAYLWIQELRDRRRLQLLNIYLLDTKEELEHIHIDTISVLILTEEAKDPYMRGHSKRVAQLCLAVAKEMGLSEERQSIIERAGKLHDLGKLGIADNILNKPCKLNDEEWEVIRKHPGKAVEILHPLKFLATEKEIILHHHERFDGGGYPAGLKGEDIPLESRIMAVVDTFDAMNSERPYREPLSRNAILLEIKRVSGTQLDPSVVSIFLTLLERNPHFWDIRPE